jgi:hypothetical protein
VTLREAVLAPFAVAAGALAFVRLVLDAHGAGAPFAVALLSLAGAAAFGPFTFAAPPGAPRWSPLRQGALAGLSFALSGALACAAAGASAASAAAGALAGPFALALGAAAYAAGGGLARAAAAALGLALLSTLFWWDQAFLFHAADRKASAALAFQLNPAAAASVTLGFDWIHSETLYRNNQTAESLVAVPLPGAGAMAEKLLAIGALAGALGLRRRP